MLRIVTYPHPALRFESRPVERIDRALEERVRSMFELMYAARGIGLAANQVAWPVQLFILNLTASPEQKDQELVFINPVIVKRHGGVEEEEGCLSFPGLYVPVHRARRVRVQAYDLTGKPFEMDAEDLLSRAIQHEIDHLHGRLYIDSLADDERSKIAGRLQEIEGDFRALQAAGVIPGDEELTRRLAGDEPAGLDVA